MQSEYNIPWIKGIAYSDCCYVNLLSLCRIYRYNPRYDPKHSIQIMPSDSKFTAKVHIKLKTKQGKSFDVFYYLPNESVEDFRDKFIKDFSHGKGGESG